MVNSVSSEVCGDASGSIDIAVFDATPPYTVSWSNGAITEDLTGLSAGSYTVTILDANQCQLQQTITVGNQSARILKRRGHLFDIDQWSEFRQSQHLP